MIHAGLQSEGLFDDAYFDTPEEVIEWAKGRSGSYNLQVDTRPEDEARGIFLTIMIRDNAKTRFYDHDSLKEITEAKAIAEVDRWADRDR